MTQNVEMLKCDQCRKRWKVAWVDGSSIDHPLTCDCGRMLKIVQVDEGDLPLMILQHSYWKTLVACTPAFAAGAFYPALSGNVMLTAYILSWIICAATFLEEDNLSASALAGIAIWSMALISGAAAVGALSAHAFWWQWQ